MWKLFEKILGKILYEVFANHKKAILYYALKGLKQFIITGFFSTLFAFILFYAVLKTPLFSTVNHLEGIEKIYKDMENNVNNCETQNCLGLAQVKNGTLQFQKVFCKDTPTGKTFEVTQNKDPLFFYSPQRQILLSSEDKDDILYLMQNKGLGLLHPIGIKPLISQSCDFSMKVLHHKKHTFFSQMGKSDPYEGDFFQVDYKIPFFINHIFPNLNTVCNPHYNASYAPTEFKEIWLVAHEPYLMWWSFNQINGTCEGRRTRKDILQGMQTMTENLLKNADRITKDDIKLNNVFQL